MDAVFCVSRSLCTAYLLICPEGRVLLASVCLTGLNQVSPWAVADASRKKVWEREKVFLAKALPIVDEKTVLHWQRLGFGLCGRGSALLPFCSRLDGSKGVVQPRATKQLIPCKEAIIASAKCDVDVVYWVVSVLCVFVECSAFLQLYFLLYRLSEMNESSSLCSPEAWRSHGRDARSY